MEIKIHNVETGEVIVREMTEEEKLRRLSDEKNIELSMQLVADNQAKKIALLEKLGITQDEAAILLS